MTIEFLYPELCNLYGDRGNMDYLRRCRATGLQAAKYYGWMVIACAKDGKMRSIDDIHNEIFLRVQECLKEN